MLIAAGGGAHASAAPVEPIPILSVTFNGTVRTTAHLGNVIYLGGDFTEAIMNGVRHARPRLAALDASTGELLDWTPSADGSVTGIAADWNGIYVVGAFSKVNGSSRDSLARLDKITGAVLAGFSHRIVGQPLAVAIGYGRLYLGGTLVSIDGVPRSGAAAISLTTGVLDRAFAPSVTGTVTTVAVNGVQVFLGGKFSQVNGVKRTQKIAAVSPTSGDVDSTFRSPVTAAVHGLAFGTGTIYAAVDGTGGRTVAMDLAGKVKWTITTDGGVQAVAVLDDVVYLGGHFDRVCSTANVGTGGECLDGSQPRIKLAAADINGGLLPWVADGNGIRGVFTLTASPELNQLSAGGNFTMINQVTQRRFALFRLPTA